QQTGGTSLDLTIANQDPHENMTCAVLVIAIHGDTTSSHLASLTFEDGSNTTTVPFSQFSQACTIPFSPTQSHGVYPESYPTTISGGVRTASSTCTVTDDDGNSNSCIYSLVLTDTSPPASAVCTATTLTTGGAGSTVCSGSGKASASATDNCDASLDVSCTNV